MAAGLRTDPWDTGFVDLAGDQGLLGQVEGRNGAAVCQWLREQGQTLWAGVTHVVIDLSAACAAAVTSELLPNAVLVVDHFHGPSGVLFPRYVCLTRGLRFAVGGIRGRAGHVPHLGRRIIFFVTSAVVRFLRRGHRICGNRGTISRDGDRQGVLGMHGSIRGRATLGHRHVDDSLRNTFAEASIITRVIAELFATRFDKQLAAGVAPEPGSALAAHVSRVASAGERRQLAEALRNSVSETHSRRTRMSARIPVDRSGVAAAVGLIDQVALRLLGPRPVSARGVARLRLLLSDGGGPMYWSGGRDLGAELRAVLAQL